MATTEGALSFANETYDVNGYHGDIGNTSHNGSHGDHYGHTSVHVIAWNFEYVATPLIVCVFIFSAGALKLGFHYASVLSSVIPESCLLIVIGVIFGAILKAVGLVERFQLHPKLFMLFLLPPIVLDSAYSLNDRVFFEHLGTILIYAVIGTILNFLMLGPTLYGLVYSGAMGDLDINLTECLLFSSFIVAVDPVAVLAIFQEVGVNNVLYFLVFGESLLNDAVTVVLSNTMKAFVSMEYIPTHQYLIGLASFFTVSLGGLFIGVLFGVFTALFTKHTSHVRVVEPLAVLTFAYLSYLTAELVHWSGIIAMIGCGLVQAEYSFHNISRKSYITVKYFIKMLSSANDCIIFLFLGIELVTAEYMWHTGFALWSLFYCLVFRFVVVFGLTFFINVSNPIHKMDLEEQFIMWYGGLRGAVCFALCDTIHEDFRHKNMFLTTTFFIILVTVFLQGSTIKPLVNLCRIRKKEEDAEILFEEINLRVTDHMMTGIEVLIEHKGSNYFRTWLVWFNDTYLIRLLQKDPMREDEKILQCYGNIVMKAYEDNINKAYLHPGAGDDDVPKSTYDTPKDVVRVRQNGDADNKSPKLRNRKLTRMDAMRRQTIGDILRGPRSVNLDDPTVNDIKVLLRHGGYTATGLHQKYDKNLIDDDRLDLEHHLEEKRRRLDRMRRMTFREFSLSDVESPALRRHAESESAAEAKPPEAKPRRQLKTESSIHDSGSKTKPKPPERSLLINPVVEVITEATPPKPKPRKYLKTREEKQSEKSQKMELLHEQDKVHSDDSALSDSETQL